MCYVYDSHDLALKLQHEEDVGACVVGPVSSQSSLRQPKATASAASNIDKPEKKSDNVSSVSSTFVGLYNEYHNCKMSVSFPGEYY